MGREPTMSVPALSVYATRQDVAEFRAESKRAQCADVQQYASSTDRAIGTSGKPSSKKPVG